MSFPLRSNFDVGQMQLLNAVAQQLTAIPTSQKAGQFYFHSGTSSMHYYTGAADYDLNISSHSLSELTAPTSALSFGGFKGTNVGLGVASTDVATMANLSAAILAAVDAAMAGLAFKGPAKLISTVNQSLTACASTIDSVAVNVGDRILLFAQTNQTQNGIYVYGAGGVLTRAADAAQNYEEQEGTTWLINEGTLNAGALYRVSTQGTITIGTTNIVITQVSQAGTVYSAGAGLLLTGTVFSVIANYYTRKASAALGNGSSTSFIVTHNLALVLVNGVYPCVMGVLDSLGNSVLCDMQSTTANTATFAFGNAPTTAQYTANIQG